MERLPKEILVNEIFLKLSVKDILNVCMTTKKFEKISDYLWLSLLKRDFLSDFSLFQTENKSNKDLYKILYRLQIVHKFLNRYTGIKVKNLYHLYYFQDLRLYRHGLTMLPKELKYLKNLKILDLRETLLPNNEIGAFESLLELRLSCNKLTSIPAEISNLRNLKILGLANNRLTSIPHEVGRLQNLRLLYLNFNELTSLPKELGALENLEELCLDNNRLTDIPHEVGALKSLQILNLGHNQLTTLPHEVGALESLQKLFLHNNQLTTLPNEIGALKNLRRLHLEDNQLISIPQEISYSCSDFQPGLRIYR